MSKEVTKIGKTIEFRYEDIGGIDFRNAIAKIEATPCSDNKSACTLSRVLRLVHAAQNEVTEAYRKDIMDVFAIRDEKGAILPEEGHAGLYKIDPSKAEEFKKVQDEFGSRTVKIKCQPMTLETLKDIKLSPKEVGLLGDLLDDSVEEFNIPEGLANLKRLQENMANA